MKISGISRTPKLGEIVGESRLSVWANRIAVHWALAQEVSGLSQQAQNCVQKEI